MWHEKIKESAKNYRDLQYNMFTIMKEMYTYEEVGQIPLRDLFAFASFLSPKQKEIAMRQQKEMLESELTNNKKRINGRR